MRGTSPPDKLGYLISAVVIALLGCLCAYTITPLFIKLFVPFPPLDKATVLEGQVKVVGDIKFGPKGGVTGPKFYMVRDGKTTEFRFGLYGQGTEPLNYPRYQGAEGKVWYHPLFGVLQWELVTTQGVRQGERLHGPYAVEQKYFAERFDYSRYSMRLVMMLACFGCSAFCIYRAFAKPGEADGQTSA